jgi:hypothetical protein
VDYQRRLTARLMASFEELSASQSPVTALRNAYILNSTVAPEAHEEFMMVGRFLMDSENLLARTRGEQLATDGEVVAVLAEKLGIDPNRDPTAATIAAAMSAAVSAAYYRWVASDGHGDLGESVATALDVLMKGLAAVDKAGKTLKRRDGR